MKASLLTAVLMIALMPLATAQAASVYGTSADWDDSRSVGNGLNYVSSNWANASVAWSISADLGLDGTIYTYSYTFSNFSRPTISHIVLDLSNDAFDGVSLIDPYIITNATVNGQAVTLQFTGASFSQESEITGAVKFEGAAFNSSLIVLEFQSNRAPVWGDFAVKGGQNLLTNMAYGSTDINVLSNTLNFIARPNGLGDVTIITIPDVPHAPTPAAATGGLVLLGLMGFARFRKRRNA